MNAREYLERIPLWADKKNSLDSIRDFLSQMGNPEEKMRIIHVAGTNGKGSVCQYMTSVLCQAGFRVGTFVSPHLEDVTERFLLCGNPVEQEEFERAFGQMRQLAEAMAGRGYAPPTYFEFLFYMFMAMMKEYKPDFVVLETGLGGRLDTTNAVRRPVLTVLTSVSMDHMQYLGNTIEEIAAEKAGILKGNVPVVYDASCPESRKVIEERAGMLGCLQVPVSQEDYTFISRDKAGIQIKTETENWGELWLPIPSQAEYQMMNAAVAVRALDVLAGELQREEARAMPEGSGRPDTMEAPEGSQWPDAVEAPEDSRCLENRKVPERGWPDNVETWKSHVQLDFGSLLRNWKMDGGDSIIRGISSSYWPGRMEQVLEGVYLDGAHNAGGVEALNKTMRRMQRETGRQVSVMFGAVSDKDHRRMIEELCDGVEISQVTIAHMDTKRSAACTELEQEFKQVINCPIKVFPTVGQAWEYFLETRGDELAFCAGSLYLVGEVKALLGRDSHTG